VAICTDAETLVPFTPEKIICGISIGLMINVASMVSTSPALPELGVIELSTTPAPTTVAVEFPDIVGSWTLVALIVTLLGLGTVAGAVYCPAEIIPYVLLPPVTPFTDQVTALLNAPVPLTCAVNN
jgi:hypothetical protein